MLAHYWTGNDDRASRKAQIIDWVTDLQDFPLGAIEGAILTWRQTQSRRPTPADIRKLILPDAKLDAHDTAARKPFPKSTLTLEQLAKHRQAIAPLWRIVDRAKAGESVDYLIRLRQRFTRKLFNRKPELGSINQTIEWEAEHGENPMDQHRSPRV